MTENNLDLSLSIKREDFEYLSGKPINMSDASRKYGVFQVNFSNWVKAGYMNVLERGWKVLIDEADVTYCAAVYQAKYKFYDGQMTSVNVFNEDGNPYQVRFQNMAMYKRSLQCKKKK